MRTLMNPMNAEKTALERAFELAKLGKCRNVDELRRQLAREGFNADQVAGPILIRQLVDTARKARAAE